VKHLLSFARDRKRTIRAFEFALGKWMTATIAVGLFMGGFVIDVAGYGLQIHGIARDAAQAAQDVRRVVNATPKHSPDARDIASTMAAHHDIAIDAGETTTRPASYMERASRALAAIAGLEDNSIVFNNATVVVRASAHAVVSAAKRLAQTLLATMVFAILLARAAARDLSRRALEPLNDVVWELELVARGNFTPRRVETSRRDEFGRLAAAYNAAIGAVTAAVEERRDENSAPHFIADAVHQLRTPLTVLRGFIGILRKGQVNSPDDIPRILETMDRQGDAIARVTERLLNFPHRGAERSVEPIDIAQFVRDTVSPFADANPHRDIRIHIRNSAKACVVRDELSYALTNLVENALKYAPLGEILIGIDCDDTAVKISVTDRGPGIPKKHLERIFDRFYRGEQRDVPGSGLGLAIARRAVERANGSLHVETREREGSRFTILLPAHAPGTEPLECCDDVRVA
jgi:signal transduction histidine kinase